MSIFARLFSDFLVTFFTVLCWNECLEYDFKEKLKKNTMIIIIQTIIIVLIATILPNSIKLFLTIFSISFINYFFITKNILDTIIEVLISQITIWTSELSFAIIYSIFIKGDIQVTTKTTPIFIVLNIYVFAFSMIILKLKIPQKIYKFIKKTTKTIENKEALFYSIMVLGVMIISTFESYMKLPTNIILITNFIMAIVMISVIIKFVSIKNKLNKIDSKYQTSMNSLKEHELVIDKLRINGHENKNELLTIRNMIKDKKTINYIDKLVDNKIKDNEKIMKKTVKIPEGGLRATIYSKMCLMDKYKINYQLDIAKDIRTTDLINLDDEILLNICKILGVFLDNSIEAIKDLKEKQIIIEIYKMDDKLNIEITNNFEGNIDINKISKTRYTTKGNGHGYGLSLVNKIINENKKILENEKMINGNNFTQILKIKRQ